MKLYLKYFSIHLRSAMEYKSSFFMTVLGQFLMSFTGFLSVWFLMDRFHEAEGFTFSEILLCYSVVLLGSSIAECFFRGFDRFPQMIGNGEFDRILTRPRNEIFQVLASKMEFTRIGRFLQALLVICYAIPTSGVIWNAENILTLIFMILGAFGVFSALYILYACFSFFTIEGLEFMNIFTNGGQEFGQYPFSVYGKWILRFFTFVVPLALCQYYPLLALLGREGSVFYRILPLCSLLFFFPVLIFWKFGVKHYKSTGS